MDGDLIPLRCSVGKKIKGEKPSFFLRSLMVDRSRSEKKGRRSQTARVAKGAIELIYGEIPRTVLHSKKGSTFHG